MPGPLPADVADRVAAISAASVGPVLAGVVTAVLWIVALAVGAHMTLPRVLLTAPMIGYAVSVWITATNAYARTGEFAGSDGPEPWIAVAGFSTAPVLVLLLPPPLVVLVVAGYAASVVALSPALSARTSNAVASVVVGGVGVGVDTVRGVDPVGGIDAALVSAHVAVATCEPGGRIPPVWHPCLGRRPATNRVDPSVVEPSLAAVGNATGTAGDGTIRLHHDRDATVTGFGRRRSRAI